MNPLVSSVRNIIRSGSRSAVAGLALLSIAVGTAQAASPDDYRLNYTWIEGGWSRLDDDVGSDNLKFDGGYVRGSFALGDYFYLLGGYSKVKDSWDASIDASMSVSIPGLPPIITIPGTLSYKGKTEISQAELGLGVHLPLANRLDFVAELTAQRWDQDVRARTTGATGAGVILAPQRVHLKDHGYGAKGLVGIRAKPFDMVDVWVKGGYFKMQDKNNLLLERSALGNVGIQLQLTPNLGVVGEADIYKKDLNIYRAGVRLSF